MNRVLHGLLAAAAGLLLAACAGTPTRPNAWAAPQALVPPSSFTGVHGLSVDAQGRLLAGSVVGMRSGRSIAPVARPRS